MENNTSFEKKFQVRVIGEPLGSIVGIVLWPHAGLCPGFREKVPSVKTSNAARRTAVPRVCREYGRDLEERGATWWALKGDGRDR